MKQSSRQLRPSFWFLLGAIAGLLNFGTLEVLRVLHYTTEDSCCVPTTDDPPTCFLCSHFSNIAGDITETFIPPTPDNVQSLMMPCVIARILEHAAAPTLARAPPACA